MPAKYLAMAAATVLSVTPARAAELLPAGTPQSAGFSTERLDRIGAFFAQEIAASSICRARSSASRAMAS